QLGPSFLPGSGARLSITSAGRLDGPCHSRLGSGRPGPGPSPDSFPGERPPVTSWEGRQQLREVASRSCFACAGSLPVFGYWITVGEAGATTVVQYMHRVAASGIVLRHSGQSRVLTAASWWKRAVIRAIGATIT